MPRRNAESWPACADAAETSDCRTSKHSRRSWRSMSGLLGRDRWSPWRPMISRLERSPAARRSSLRAKRVIDCSQHHSRPGRSLHQATKYLVLRAIPSRLRLPALTASASCLRRTKSLTDFGRLRRLRNSAALSDPSFPLKALTSISVVSAEPPPRLDGSSSASAVRALERALDGLPDPLPSVRATRSSA